MGISARNVFKGKVTKIKEGPIHAEIEITTAAGHKIIATLTEASVKNLKLAVGKKAVAVVKAPLVSLLTGTPKYRFSARNQLEGTVKSLIKGEVNSQVDVALIGGSTLSAVITSEAVEDLALKKGTPVIAIFKAGQVLVGVAA